MNFNLDKNTDDFNISKLDTATYGLAQLLKILYQEGLPWKIKYQLLRNISNKRLNLQVFRRKLNVSRKFLPIS